MTPTRLGADVIRVDPLTGAADSPSLEDVAPTTAGNPGFSESPGGRDERRPPRAPHPAPKRSGAVPIAAHQAPDDADPRRQRSRARLLAAAGELLATGGIDAVTVEAVTQLSRVARTTLYRHFRGVAQLRAAALQRLLMPPCDPAAARGSLRDRLIELVARQALSIDDAPLHTTTLAWLATAGHTEVDAGPEAATLRHRLTEEYLRPFEELLTGTEAVAELGVCDIRTAVAQLIGPIVFTRIAGSGRSTGEDCVRLVDDFLAARTARHTGSTGGTTSGK